MFKILLPFILLTSATASQAADGYVTCRQTVWQKVSSTDPIYSLKEKACQPLDVRFFESKLSIGAGYCEKWKKEEAGLSADHSVETFNSLESCQKELNHFRSTSLGGLRPMVFDSFFGTGYLYFLDASIPNINGEGKETARWTLRGDQWFCSLPGQNFYVRYAQNGVKHYMYIEGLSLAIQVYELVGNLGPKLFWRNLDLHSPFAQVENTTDSPETNFFVVSDSKGNIITQMSLTYILDPKMDPILTCY